MSLSTYPHHSLNYISTLTGARQIRMTGRDYTLTMHVQADLERHGCPDELLKHVGEVLDLGGIQDSQLVQYLFNRKRWIDA
jgi:hypothetical protein